MSNQNILPDHLRAAFEFTRKERKAIYWMIGLIIFVRITPIFISFLIPPSKEKNDEILRTYLSEIRESPEYKKSKAGPMINVDTIPLNSLFVFDPNQLSPDSLMLLGISRKVADNWHAYRSKGGRFRRPVDVLKIYGMDSMIYERLNPYISISSDPVHPNEIIVGKADIPKSNISPTESVNINRADAAELKKLNGIGNVLSERIIKYRNLLGGFYTIDQLGEVYGISDETLATIRSSVFTDGKVVMIDPSKLQFRDLLRHPYIDYELAQILSNHKDATPGGLDSILRIEIPPEAYSRLIPYLTDIN